jgi:hypothetical protein
MLKSGPAAENQPSFATLSFPESRPFENALGMSAQSAPGPKAAMGNNTGKGLH